MSVEVMGKVWRRYPFGGSERLLALALADHADDDGTSIYPGIPHLAAKTLLSERQVMRLLQQMLAHGWLQLVKAGAGGRPTLGRVRSSRRTEYRINPRWLDGEQLPIVAREMGDKTAPISQRSERPEIGDKTAPISDAEPSPESVTKNDEMGDNGDAAYKGNHQGINPPTPQGGGGSTFEALCRAYPPHRVNYSAALKRWQELNPDEQLQAVMVREAAVQADKPEWKANHGKIVPKLSGWILNRGWMWTHQAEAPAAQTAVTRNGTHTEPALSDEERAAQRQRALEAREHARRIAQQMKAGKVARP